MDIPKRSHQLLEHLWNRADWSGLEQLARESLATDPEDAYPHLARAEALLHLNRFPESSPHIRFLLTELPDNSLAHRLAARYWIECRKPDYAYWHINECLQIEPENSTSMGILGAVLCMKGNLKLGMAQLRKARELDPEDTTWTELELSLRGLTEVSALDRAQQRIEVEGVLTQNPESVSAHAMLGDLEHKSSNFKAAMGHYRDALNLDPTSVECQRKVRELIPMQNILSRTLFLPVTFFKWLEKLRFSFRLLLIGLLAFKGVIIAFGWLTIVGLLFYPVAKVYEFLFLADLPILAHASSFKRATMLFLKKIPFWVRVSILLGIWWLFWSSIFGVFGCSKLTSAKVILGILGFHLLAVAIVGCSRRLDIQGATQIVEMDRKSRFKRLWIIAGSINALFLSLIALAVYWGHGVTPLLILFGAINLLLLSNWWKYRSLDREYANPGKLPPVPHTAPPLP